MGQEYGSRGRDDIEDEVHRRHGGDSGMDGLRKRGLPRIHDDMVSHDMAQELARLVSGVLDDYPLQGGAVSTLKDSYPTPS